MSRCPRRVWFLARVLFQFKEHVIVWDQHKWLFWTTTICWIKAMPHWVINCHDHCHSSHQHAGNNQWFARFVKTLFCGVFVVPSHFLLHVTCAKRFCSSERFKPRNAVLLTMRALVVVSAFAAAWQWHSNSQSARLSPWCKLCRLSAIARSKWLEEVVTLQKELAELAGTQPKMDKTVLMRRQPLTRIIQRWSRVSRVNNFTWFSGYVNMFAFFYHLLKKDHHASFHISELRKCLWKLCKVVDLFCENSAKLWKFADQRSAEVCNVRSFAMSINLSSVRSCNICASSPLHSVWNFMCCDYGLSSHFDCD